MSETLTDSFKAALRECGHSLYRKEAEAEIGELRANNTRLRAVMASTEKLLRDGSSHHDDEHICNAAAKILEDALARKDDDG